MRWLWKPGRQGTGYWKLRLLSWEPYFDLYLLRYPVGSAIPPHRDSVDGRRHFRANLTLRFAQFGGHFRHDGCLLFDRRRLVVFRPDIQEHYVSQVLRGERLVLSLGWTLKDKTDA